MPSLPLIFTVCHINQLANAFVLGDSIKKHHPDYQFFIGLVDSKKNIPAKINSPYPIIDIEELNLDGFAEMSRKYTWDELSADCKPFFAQYFLEKNKNKIIYFDCTSIIYQPISFLSEILDNQSIILVPQLLHAGVHPDEKQILNTGIFHSGFFALKHSTEVISFLNWWKENTKTKGFHDLCKGLNADQLWLEHVPAMFENVSILKEEGINIGYWNLSERNIYSDENKTLIDEKKVISVNFKGLKYWKSYKNLIEQYQDTLLKTVKPSYGIPNPKDKTFQKNIAKNIRAINYIFDWFLDKIS